MEEPWVANLAPTITGHSIMIMRRTWDEDHTGIFKTHIRALEGFELMNLMGFDNSF